MPPLLPHLTYILVRPFSFSFDCCVSLNLVFLFTSLHNLVLYWSLHYEPFVELFSHQGCTISCISLFFSFEKTLVWNKFFDLISRIESVGTSGNGNGITDYISSSVSVLDGIWKAVRYNLFFNQPKCLNYLDPFIKVSRRIRKPSVSCINSAVMQIGPIKTYSRCLSYACAAIGIT